MNYIAFVVKENASAFYSRIQESILREENKIKASILSVKKEVNRIFTHIYNIYFKYSKFNLTSFRSN